MAQAIARDIPGYTDNPVLDYEQRQITAKLSGNRIRAISLHRELGENDQAMRELGYEPPQRRADGSYA
jgi:hypothetical protein